MLYASAVCVSGDGVLGHQRKVHLPPAERFAYTAGDGFAAFDTPVGRVGMLLCYDKLFPEAARALALDGADDRLLAGGLAGRPPAPGRRHRATTARPATSTSATQTRAVENQVVVGLVQPDRAVGPAALPRLGQGRRPGRRRARRAPAPTRASPSPRSTCGAIHEIRLGIDHLADRRPDAYAPPCPRPPCSGSRAERPVTLRPCAESSREHGGSDPAGARADARAPHAPRTRRPRQRARRRHAGSGTRRLSIVDLDGGAPAARRRATTAPTSSATARSTTTRRCAPSSWIASC